MDNGALFWNEIKHVFAAVFTFGYVKSVALTPISAPSKVRPAPPGRSRSQNFWDLAGMPVRICTDGPFRPHFAGARAKRSSQERRAASCFFEKLQCLQTRKSLGKRTGSPVRLNELQWTRKAFGASKTRERSVVWGKLGASTSGQQASRTAGK